MRNKIFFAHHSSPRLVGGLFCDGLEWWVDCSSSAVEQSQYCQVKQDLNCHDLKVMAIHLILILKLTASGAIPPTIRGQAV